MSNLNIYSDELYSKVNQDSKDLLNDYILELKSKNRSEKTIKQYTYDIKLALCYFQENNANKSILELRKRDFRNFFLMMSDSGKSSARINRMQSSLRNMLEYAVDDDDYYEDYYKNPMRNIKSLERMAVKDVVFISDEQIDFLLDYLMERELYQKALYVSLSYDSAGRRNEIHQVEKYSFMDSENRSTNEVVGKRSKRFKLMYSDRTVEIAQLWLEQRGSDDIDSLWIVEQNGKKQPLGYDLLYRFAYSFRSILENEYDKDMPIGSHSFRHSSLENYSNGTHHSLQYFGIDKLDIDTLRMLANHADVGMTQKYLRDKDEEILNNLFGNKKD